MRQCASQPAGAATERARPERVGLVVVRSSECPSDCSQHERPHVRPPLGLRTVGPLAGVGLGVVVAP